MGANEMRSPTALMGDGVQPGVLSSSTWVLRSDPKGRRDCSTRLIVGPLPQSDLCMVFCLTLWAGTPKNSHRGVHLLCPFAGDALFHQELSAAITVIKGAHPCDSWELEFDPRGGFTRKYRASLRIYTRHALPSMGLREKNTQWITPHCAGMRLPLRNTHG